MLGLAVIFFRADSMGAGTYTGIEAVSNGLPILREPKPVTGKRTMIYIAVSLAFIAGGILIAYCSRVSNRIARKHSMRCCSSN